MPSSTAARVACSASSTRAFFSRSEEHTSELQSQSNLVCRVLLEKKKTGVLNGPVRPAQRPLPNAPSAPPRAGLIPAHQLKSPETHYPDSHPQTVHRSLGPLYAL